MTRRERVQLTVTAHLVLAAQILVHRAIDVGDQHRRGGRKLVAELVPSGLHVLAVTSPRCKKLDEGVLASVEAAAERNACQHVVGEAQHRTRCNCGSSLKL